MVTKGKVITGTAGDDRLQGAPGDDVINGLGGNDSIDGLGGNDILNGGDGNDSIYGSGGNDILNGGDGNDELTASGQNSTINGGAGDDLIDSFYGSGTIDGGSGNDTIKIVPWGPLLITTGTGSDQIIGSPGTDDIVVTDFTAGDGGDILSLTPMLRYVDSYAGVNPFATGHFSLVQSGADTLVMVDYDGTGTRANPGRCFLLQNVTASTLTAFNFGGYAPDGSAPLGQTIAGTADNDTLSGLAGDDVIDGLDGNDTIDGGDGNDILNGGDGNDVLSDDFGTNTFVGGAGSDRISTSKNGNIDAGAGDDRIDLNRNASVVITTGLGSDLITVNDTEATAVVTDFTPGAGGDVFKMEYFLASFGYHGGNPFATGHVALVQSGSDTLLQIVDNGPGSGNAAMTMLTLQNVTASALTAFNFDGYSPDGSPMPVQTFTGTAVSDFLVGSFEDDVFNGLAGNDRVIARDGNDLINGGDGNDDIYAGYGADTINGDAGKDLMYGDEGNDLLNGGLGTDTMVGGLGDDTYVVDVKSDKVVEAADEGSDTIQTALKQFVIGANIENLTFTSNGEHTGTGNALDNHLIGGAGNDVLDGKAGADVAEGGLGDDTYYVDNVGDSVIEAIGGGTDRVVASASFALAADSQVETLTLKNVGAALNLTGSDSANVLIGNSKNNTLSGQGGDDTLYGGNGNDTLTGGAGADRFVFDFKPKIAGNLDTVTDFVSGSDTLAFDKTVFKAFAATGAISAEAFWSGQGVSAAHDADDRIIYNSTTGALFYDADGTGKIAARQVAVLAGHPDLAFGDILIVA